MISVRGLNMKIGDFNLRDVSLDVAPGEYFIVLGQTGAGKTLFIESIAGLLHPQQGTISIDGRDVTHLRPEDRRVGYLPQDYALFPHLSVRQNIGFGMRIAKKPDSFIKSKTEQLTKILGITHLLDRTVHHLSGGERQRTALARALAIEPKVLLLDEPLSALDEQTRENLCGELRRVHDKFGMTTVHISHSFEETLALADRVAIVNQGRIEQVGPPKEVMAHPASEFVANFVRCQNILPGQACAAEKLSLVKLAGTEIYSTCPTAGAVIATVRPEELTLSYEAPLRESHNVFRAKVTQLLGRGALTRVDLAAFAKVQNGASETPAQADFIALCTQRRCESLALAPGKEIYLSFAPEMVHLISRSEATK